MKKIHLLCVILLILMVNMLSFSVAEYEGRLPELPEQVKSISQFNDCSLFEVINNAPNAIYQLRDNPTCTEAYLRFAIPGFDPSACRLRLRIKARPELLKDAKVRSARDLRHGGDVMGDVATFDIPMEDSAPFMWTDGRCYVGLAFPKTSLRPGDTVELLDFKFEFAK